MSEREAMVSNKVLDDETREQIAKQCDVVVALCQQIAKVHRDNAAMVRNGHYPTTHEIVGQNSAGHMETLGDIANGMNIVQPEDEWMTPIFEAAHRLFPKGQP